LQKPRIGYAIAKADPRFFKNLGPFSLAQICEKIGIARAAGSDGAQLLFDLADLSGAGPRHVTFYSGARGLRDSFAASKAGLCLVPSSEKGGKCPAAPAGMSMLEVASVGRAFAGNRSGVSVPLEAHERADRNVELPDLVGAAELRQVDDEARRQHLGAHLAQKGIALGLINHNLLSDLSKIMGDPVALGTEAFP